MSIKFSEPCRPVPTLCSPIKNSPQKLKLGLSPRRSPRINRYPLAAYDGPESPLRTPHVTKPIKIDSAFLYPVVSSTPLKLESTPITTPTVTSLRTIESCEPMLPSRLNLNVEWVPSTVPQKQSPHKAVLSELQPESNKSNLVEENPCERFGLHNSTVTSMSESESKPIRRVKKKRKCSRSQSHRSSQSMATGDTQNSQTNDDIKDKNLMKSDSIQIELPVEDNDKLNTLNTNNIDKNNSRIDDISNDSNNKQMQQNDTLVNEEMNNISMDYLSQTNSFVLEPTQDELSDPEITINTKNLLRDPLQLGNVVQQAEEQRSKEFCIAKEETGETIEEPVVKGDEDVHAYNGDFEKDNEEILKVDEKEETDILLKSFAEENFSNDSINEEEQDGQTERKVFHGFTDPEIREAEEYCHVSNGSNEHLKREVEEVEVMEVDNGDIECNVKPIINKDDDEDDDVGRHSSSADGIVQKVIIIDNDEVFNTNNIIRHSSVGFSERKSSTGIAFSDDDDEDGQHSVVNINQDIFKFNQDIFNTSKVIEIQDVDDICGAILRQGSTPKRDTSSSTITLRRNRTSSNQQQQPPLSPTVVTGHLTPHKRNRTDGHNPFSSPLSRKGNLRSHKTSSSDQSVPVVNLNNNNNNSKKRRATTPISERSRKRSRTSSNLDLQHQQSNTLPTIDDTTMNSCLQKDDLDDVFETETESQSESVNVPVDEIRTIKPKREKYRTKLKTKKPTSDNTQSTSHTNNNNKLSPCIEVDLGLEMFGNMNTLSDRIKRRSRKSESSKSSSSRSCSPSRKASSEKVQRAAATELSRPKPNLLSRRSSPRKRQDEWRCSSPSSNLLNIKFERKKCSPFEDPSKGKSLNRKHSSNTSAILGDFEKNEKESSLLDDSSSSKTPSRASKNKKKSPAPRSSKKEKNTTSSKKKISSSMKPKLKNYRGQCDQLDQDIVSEFEAHDADLKRQANKQRPLRKCKGHVEGFFWEE